MLLATKFGLPYTYPVPSCIPFVIVWLTFDGVIICLPTYTSPSPCKIKAVPFQRTVYIDPFLNVGLVPLGVRTDLAPNPLTFSVMA